MITRPDSYYRPQVVPTNTARTTAAKALTVTQVTGMIKGLLEHNFPRLLIEGEMSNCKLHPSGHIYFTLKDDNAVIDGIMYRGRTQYLKFTPRDGMKVRVSGTVTIYQRSSKYQIVADSISIVGAGDILAMLEERKRVLAAEGLFDSARKKPLPKYPRTIGVITASSGAAIRDIIRITRARNTTVNILVLPALVQGADAAPSIIRMIKIANAYRLCDVLIIGRGGGSIEDLLPFSEESVVRAIAASTIPTISAVGHDIDWAISDYVADRRAATPSDGAAIAVPRKEDILKDIAVRRDAILQQLRHRVDRARLLLKPFSPDAVLMRFRHIEQPLQQRFDIASEGLKANMRTKLERLHTRLDAATKVVKACSPEEILRRGYSIAINKDTGRVLRDSQEVDIGTVVELRLNSGTLDTKVINRGDKAATAAV